MRVLTKRFYEEFFADFFLADLRRLCPRYIGAQLEKGCAVGSWGQESNRPGGIFTTY